jgi:hypothetical protein
MSIKTPKFEEVINELPEKWKYSIQTYKNHLVSSFVLLSVLGILLSVSAIGPPSVFAGGDVNAEDKEFQTNSEMNIKTTVSQPTETWNIGTLLENNGYYPMNKTDEVTVEGIGVISGSNASVQSISITIEHRLLASEDGSEIWSESQIISKTSRKNQTQTGAARGQIDIEEIHSKHTDLTNDYANGGVEAESVISVSIKYNHSYRQINHGEIDRSSKVTTKKINSTIDIGESLYQIPSKSTSETIVDSVETPNKNPNIFTWISLLLIPIGAVGSVGVRFSCRSLASRKQLEETITADERSEWISNIRGTIPCFNDKQKIYMKSLDDLIDQGIDEGMRVKRSDDGIYWIHDDEIVYIYDKGDE